MTEREIRKTCEVIDRSRNMRQAAQLLVVASRLTRAHSSTLREASQNATKSLEAEQVQTIFQLLARPELGRKPPQAARVERHPKLSAL